MLRLKIRLNEQEGYLHNSGRQVCDQVMLVNSVAKQQRPEVGFGRHECHFTSMILKRQNRNNPFCFVYEEKRVLAILSDGWRCDRAALREDQSGST